MSRLILYLNSLVFKSPNTVLYKMYINLFIKLGRRQAFQKSFLQPEAYVHGSWLGITI